MLIKLFIIGFIIFSIGSFINIFILRNDKEEEYLEPNEFMTLQDCLDIYYHDNKRMVIENGQVTKII